MPYTPLTRRQGGLIAKLLLIGFAVQLGIIGYVLYQSYVGREDLVKAEQAGCNRSKLDREANALGWRTAETARLHSVAREMHISFDQARMLIKLRPLPYDPSDLVTAREYDRIAAGQEARSRIACSKAFPKASLLP